MKPNIIKPIYTLGVLVLVLCFLVGCTGDFRSTSGWSGALLDDDKVYIGTKEANLTVLDKDTGRYLWSFPRDGDDLKIEGIYGTPIVAEDSIFFGSYSGELFALDPNSERVIWKFPTDGHIVGSPLHHNSSNGHKIIVGSTDKHLYSIDMKSGRLDWSFEADGEIWSSPVEKDGIIYFGSLDGKLYAVHGETVDTNQPGDLKWTYETSGAIASSAVITSVDNEDVILIGSFDRMLYALDLNGQLTWNTPFEATNWFWATPVVVEDTIYAPSTDGGLYAINLFDGNKVWQSPFMTEGPIVSSPAIVGKNRDIVIGSDDGSVYLVDRQNGREIRSFNTDDHVRANITSEVNKVIISGNDHQIRLADLEDGFWIETWCYNTKDKSNNCK